METNKGMYRIKQTTNNTGNKAIAAWFVSAFAVVQFIKTKFYNHRQVAGLIVFFSIGLAPILSSGEPLIDTDISVNTHGLSFSKNRPFSYCLAHEEQCTQVAAGGEVSLSVDQGAVFRWGDDSASYKLSFSPLLNSAKPSSAVYQFDLPSAYFPHATLVIYFGSEQGLSSNSCLVLILDSALSEAMQSNLTNSLADQNIGYERYENYLAIACQNKT